MIGRNIGALLTAQAAGKAISFLVSIALVRWLGPHELGRYAYVLAFCYPFGALADFGLGTLTIREASRAPGDAARLLAVVRRLALACAGVAFLLMLGLAVLLRHDPVLLGGIALAGLASLVSALTMPSLALMSAREQLDRVSLHRLVGTLLASALTVGVLLAGGGLLALLGASLAVTLLMWALARALAGPIGPAPAPSLAALGATLAQAVPFGLLMAGFALYYRIDMVMLEWLTGPREVGLYAAAYRFLDSVIVLAATLGGPLFPRLSSLVAESPAAARRLLEDAWRPLLALGLPVTLGTAVLARDLVTTLFGADFADAGTLLRLLIGGTLPLLWVNFGGHALIAADRVWPLVRVYLLSALVNVAGNLLLIPRWGAAGSAVATLVCEWLNLAVVVWLLRDALGLRLPMAGLWRYAGAGAAMLVALWAVDGTGVLVGVATGALAYSGALLALGYAGSADHVAVKRLLAQ